MAVFPIMLAVLCGSVVGGEQPQGSQDRVWVGFDAAARGLDPAAVQQALQVHLADTDFTVDVVTPEVAASGEAAPQVRALLWVDGETLHLRLPGQSGSWTRTLPSTDDPDVLLESLGVMVRGMIPIIPPTPKAEPPKPEPEPEPTPKTVQVVHPATPPPDPPHLDLDVGYLGGSLASNARWQHGVGLSAGIEAPSGIVARLGVGWYVPRSVSGVPQSRVQRVPVDAAAGYRFGAAQGWAVRPELAAVVSGEAIGWRVESDPSFAGRDGWGLRMGLGAEVGVRWMFWRSLFLFGRVRGTGWPVNVEIITDGEADRRALLRPHPGSVSGVVGFGASLALGGR